MPLDARALTELYRSEGPALLRACTRRTLDADLALEVVAETFAVAFEKRRRFRGSSQAEAAAWLFAISRTVLHAHYRRGRAERAALQRLGIDPPVMGEDERRRVEELAGLDGLRRVLGVEVTRLPADQQHAIRLRVLDELSYPEVAKRLRVSEPTARARVSRGLRALASVPLVKGLRDE